MMTINVKNLSDEQLLQAYQGFTGDKNDSLPLSDNTREAILFGFSTADIVYVDLVEGKWIDVTPEGVEGTATVSKDANGNIKTDLNTYKEH